jgi:uncharacterized membrane protein
MPEPSQEFFYRGTWAFALVIVFFAIVSFAYQTGHGEPMIPVAPFFAAGGVWLLGWFCRRVSAGRSID